MLFSRYAPPVDTRPGFDIAGHHGLDALVLQLYEKQHDQHCL
jgi:hypothetical protein